MPALEVGQGRSFGDDGEGSQSRKRWENSHILYTPRAVLPGFVIHPDKGTSE